MGGGSLADAARSVLKDIRCEGTRSKPSIGAVRSGQSNEWEKKRKDEQGDSSLISHPPSITRVEKIEVLDLSSSPPLSPPPLVESRVLQHPYNIGFQVPSTLILNIFTQS